MFYDKSHQPGNDQLASVLGNTKLILDDIYRYIYDNHGIFVPEWKYYTKDSGWILKHMLKKRNLFFIVPCKGFFKISFVFGAKAVLSIMESTVPAKIKQELEKAKKIYGRQRDSIRN